MMFVAHFRCGVTTQ